MAYDTVVCIKDKQCRKAIERFVKDLGKQVALRASTSEIEGGRDIEFADAPSESELRITWTVDAPLEIEDLLDWPVYEEDEEEDEAARAPVQMIRHYARHLAAIAGNPEAAKAMLKRTEKARQKGRTEGKV